MSFSDIPEQHNIAAYYVQDDQPVYLDPAESAFLDQFMYKREEIQEKFMKISKGINLLWLMMVSTYLFMMQVGFMFMASGGSVKKNSSSILTNHLLTICTCTLVYILISSELSMNGKGGLIGTQMEVHEISKMTASTLWHKSAVFVSFIRCLTATTIASMQLQERTLSETHLLSCIILTGLIFPVVQCWTEGDGFLS